MVAKVNLELYQGTNFSYDIQCVDDSTGANANLVSYSIRSQVRRSHQNANVVLNMTISNQNLNAGLFTISANANSTANVYPDTHVIDLELYDAGGNVFRILTGTVEVVPRVTR